MSPSGDYGGATGEGEAQRQGDQLGDLQYPNEDEVLSQGGAWWFVIEKKINAEKYLGHKIYSPYKMMVYKRKKNDSQTSNTEDWVDGAATS